MKCPYRKYILTYKNMFNGEKHQHEEYEECYKNECPFYAKKENREFCMRANLEVIENHVKNYTF